MPRYFVQALEKGLKVLALGFSMINDMDLLRQELLSLGRQASTGTACYQSPSPIPGQVCG